MYLRNNKQSGFTMFFAVIVVSIVISIGITLSLIAQKETSLAGLRRESNIAWYAAGSGSDCVLYWLMRTVKTQPAPTQINAKCNSSDGTNNVTYDFTSTPSGTLTDTFDFESPYLYRSSISLTRLNSGSSWEIDSSGYNRRGVASVKLLRGQKIAVTPGVTTGSANDVMVLIDHSGSICPPDGGTTMVGGTYDATRENNNCGNHLAMREAALMLIDLIDPDPTLSGRNRLGVITFAGIGQGVNSGSPYPADFGQPKIQTHLNATKAQSKAVIQATNYVSSDKSTYLNLSYGDGTNIADAIRLANCELSGYVLNSTSYTSACTTLESPAHQTSDTTYPDTIIIFTDGRHNIYNDAGTRKTNWGTNSGQCREGWEELEAEAVAYFNANPDSKTKIFIVGVGNEIDEDACSSNSGSGALENEPAKAFYHSKVIKGKGKFYDIDPTGSGDPLNNWNKTQIINTFKTIVEEAGLSIKVIE